MDSRKCRRLLKVVILGDSGVGKTSLMNQFVKKRFSGQYRATIGADFLSKDLTVDGHDITMQIWDTAGQERFQSLGVAFYRGADCCVIVYDLTSSQSFASVESWRDEFLLQSGAKNPQHFPFLLVGNKSDVAPELIQVKLKQVTQWCEERQLLHATASARTGHNVDKLFTELVRLALAQCDLEEDEQYRPTPLTLRHSSSHPSSNNTTTSVLPGNCQC